MSEKTLSQEIIKKTKEAIKQFGKYSFEDKGPNEVMDLDPLIAKFKLLSQDEKIKLAKLLKKNPDANAVLITMIKSDESLNAYQVDEIVKEGGAEIVDHFRPRNPVNIPITTINDLDNLFKKK